MLDLFLEREQTGREMKHRPMQAKQLVDASSRLQWAALSFVRPTNRPYRDVNGLLMDAPRVTSSGGCGG